MNEEFKVPPPRKLIVRDIAEVPVYTDLRGSRGTFIITSVKKFMDLGFDKSKHSISNMPNGMYIVLVSEMQSITKQEIMDAFQIENIIQYSIDVPFALQTQLQ